MKNEYEYDLQSSLETRGTLLNGKPLKVAYEEENTMSERAIKKARLLAVLVMVAGLSVIGLGTTKKVMNQTEEYMGTEYYKYQTAEPVEEVKYVAPSGYTLEYHDGVAYATKTTIETMPATKRTTYTVPNGYVLVGTKGVKGDEVINATAKTTYYAPSGWTLNGTTATRTITETRTADKITTYSAPEGYIRIGDKCYKVTEPEEKVKGR